MLSADSTTPQAAAQALYDSEDDDLSAVSLAEVLTWLGERKRFIAAFTLGVAVVAAIVALLLPSIYTAKTTFLAPVSQQQGGAGSRHRAPPARPTAPRGG